MKFNNIIINFIGFLITIFIIWNRFLRFNFSLSSYTLSKTFYMFILFVFIIILIVLLISAISKIIKYQPKSYLYKLLINNIYIKQILQIFLQIKNSPKVFYKTYIFPRVKIVFFVEKPIFFVVKQLARKSKDFIYIIFCFIPRIIVATYFILSIFYFNDLIYFYKSLFLLILPLLYNVYLYIIIHLCDYNIPYFKSHLKFTKSIENGFFDVDFADKKPNYIDAIDIVKNKNNTQLLEWFIYNFDIYTNIKNFTIKLENIEEKYKPYENIFVYSCYLLGWCYILFKCF